MIRTLDLETVDHVINLTGLLVIYLDFAKKKKKMVSHNRLVKTRRQVKITVQVERWIKFLNGSHKNGDKRMPFIVEVTGGVLQGSVLGLDHFNDLLEGIRWYVRMFARIGR